MLQFSLQRLFVSIGLMAIGCAAIALMHKARVIGRLLPPGPERHILVGGALLIAGAILVAAGFGNLCRRPILGAAIGFLLTLTCIVIAFGVSTLVQK
jgi:hypothetical protein